MSAHVIAKPQPFSAEDDEKTTIESAWEEEASTTVEQGEVADKIRALGIEPKQPSEGNTSTSGAPLEELTVDEQRGNPAAFSLMTPPVVAPARIVVTQGNDTGQEIEIRPGKIYSIGRGIDNDFVLTDITVSRKHFELRYEGDAWILADRGSGNGTLVNGNIEDHPFMLANGDTIEIGNTLFRFDYANGATRSPAGYEVDLDEEEPSTVAGKPLRNDVPIPQTPQPLPPPQIIARPTRPKTQPPPPPRPRVSTMQPVYPAAPQMQPIVGAPMPLATTLPMPQMTPRSPMASPSERTMLGDPIMQSPAMHPPMMPTTLPGGHVAPLPPAHVLPFTYPVIGSAERASQPPHAQMLVIAAAHAQGRDATSTALVQPVPYNGMMPGTPQSFTAAPRQTAPISRRTKLVLGGAALTMIAAITTVIIIKTVGGNNAPANTAKTNEPEKSTPPAKEQATKEQFSIKPIDTKDSGKVATDDAKKKVDQAIAADDAKKKADDAKKKADDAKKKADEEAKQKAIADAKAVEEAKRKAEEDSKKKVADEEARRKADEKRIVDDARRKADEDNKRKLAEQRQAENKAADERRKQEAQARREIELAKQEERKKAAEERKRQDEERKKASAQARTKEPTATTTKRVASAGPVNGEARDNAQREYKAKNFAAAGAVLRAAAANASGGDANDLRALAGTYEQFGKAYNVGMAPGTPPAEAFEKLRRAKNFDPSLGGGYTSDITGKLKEIAPKAAIYFAAKKDFENALVAVKTAESLGLESSNGNLKTVRSAIEQEANRLYTEAASGPPDQAKEKARRILNLIDSKSPTYAKAQKLLNS